MAKGSVRTFVEQASARLSVPVFTAAAAMWVAYNSPEPPHAIGTSAIVYDTATAPLFVGDERRETRHRIQVVDSGLEEATGLAYHAASNSVYFTDAWDAIGRCQITFDTDGTHCAKQPAAKAWLPATEICPDDRCEPVEHGGLAVHGNDLIVADTHEHRLLAWDISGAPAMTDRWRPPGLGRARDVAVMDADHVIVAEAAPPQSSDGNDAGTAPRKHGALAVIDADGRRVPIGIDVNDPLGVAYSPPAAAADPGWLYVADLADRAITWRRLKHAAGTWSDEGVVWTQAVESKSTRARLHSMRIGRKNGREALFAAAPDGLAVIDPKGTLLARYILGVSVSGLAWDSTNNLFLAVGRRLCVLKTYVDRQPLVVPAAAPAPPPPLTPSPAVIKPPSEPEHRASSPKPGPRQTPPTRGSRPNKAPRIVCPCIPREK